MPFALSALLEGAGAKTPPAIAVSGINSDSRAIAAGEAFFAIPGTRVHGDSFAAEARALLTRIVSGDLTGEGAGIAARGDYAAILPRLTRAFDPARLLVLFYEEMLTAPGLARLWSFLGIRPVDADLGRRVHEGTPLTMNEDERRAARAWLRPQYDYVSGQFATLPAAWRANMEEGLA